MNMTFKRRVARKPCVRMRTTTYVARSGVAAMVVLLGFTLSACAEDLPDPNGVRSDELLADWLAQDSGVKANEDFFAGELAATTP